MSSIENSMAMIDSIGCAGEAHGKSVIVVSSLVRSSFNLFKFSRPNRILDASVSSPMIWLTYCEIFVYFTELNIATSTLLY